MLDVHAFPAGRRIVLGSGAVGVLSWIVAMPGTQAEGIAALVVIAVLFIVLTWLIDFGSDAAAWLQAVLLFAGGWFLFSGSLLALVFFGVRASSMLGLVMGIANLIAAGLLFGSHSVHNYIWQKRAAREGAPDWDSFELPAADRKSISGVDTADLLEAARRRRVLATLVLAIMLATWAAVAAGLALFVYAAVNTAGQAVAEIEHTVSGQVESLAREAGPTTAIFGSAVLGLGAGAGAAVVLGMFMVLTPIYSYLGWFVAPFVVVAPITAAASAAWQRPMHVMLLRPFNRDWVTRRLQREIRREVRPMGHIYTLADLQLQVPWYVRVPFLNAQLSMLSFRTAKIRVPDDLKELVARMERRVARNMNWFHSLTGIFAVRCADAGWQTCVRCLAARVDAIVLDLSVPTPSIDWELRTLRELDRLQQTIVVYPAGQKARTLEALAVVAVQPDDVFAIVAYGNEGLAARPALRQTLANLATR